MNPAWNPAFDLGFSALMAYLWIKRWRRPYWQGLLGFPLLLAANLLLSTLTPQGDNWLCMAAIAGKLTVSLVLLGLWTGVFVHTVWSVRSALPYLLLGLLSLILTGGLLYLPRHLPQQVLALQAQNAVLVLLTLLTLSFLHWKRLYQGSLVFTLGVVLLMFLPLALFYWGYCQLTPEVMLQSLPYLRWVPPLSLSGIWLIEVHENRVRLMASQAELTAFEARQAQQYANYRRTVTHLQQIRYVRHDIYNYIQAALYLGQSDSPEDRQKARSLIDQVYETLDAQRENFHEL